MFSLKKYNNNFSRAPPIYGITHDYTPCSSSYSRISANVSPESEMNVACLRFHFRRADCRPTGERKELPSGPLGRLFFDWLLMHYLKLGNER